jgi:hypothetical protein
LRFLDHEGAAGVGLAWHAEVFYIVEGAVGEPVEPDAVLPMVDHLVECGDETELVGVLADDLEHGLLDSVPVGLADLRDAAESGLALGCGGVHVVGDEKVHVS